MGIFPVGLFPYTTYLTSEWLYLFYSPFLFTYTLRKFVYG